MKMRVLFLSCALASPAFGNLIVNGSFEAGNFIPNGDNTMQLPTGATNITGWLVYTDSLAWIADPNPFSGIHASDGTKQLDLTNYTPGAPYGGIRQSFLTSVGARYRVSFDLGTHPAYSAASSVTVSAGAASQTFTATAATGQRWDRVTWEFIAASTSTELSFRGDVPSVHYSGLDNVVVELIGGCATQPDGDLNGSGAADGDDLQPFVSAVFANSTAPEIVCHADFNASGSVESGDVSGMVAALLH